MPSEISLFHREEWSTLSKALRKSTKQMKRLVLDIFACSIRALRMKIQSVVLLFLRKPNCDSGKISVLSAHSVKSIF